MQKPSRLRLTAPRILALSLCSASVVFAQAGNKSAEAVPDFKETEIGIPVTDKLTIEKCGACHTADNKGNLSRISWTRATPEAWSQAIKRMVKLNGAQLTPEEARNVVKYLANSHGLAPEEAKTVMYIPERRILDETIIPNDTVRQACAACHAFGVPMSSRRTRNEWALLQNMHIALYSQAEVQIRRPAPTEPGQPAPAEGAKKPTHGEVALDYLTKAAALHTPEWAAWAPRIRDPKLAGKWLVTADVPGHGKFVGEMTIQPGKDGDEFGTSTTLRSLTNGETITRKGSGLVYTGYSWRGRSQGNLNMEKPDDLQSVMRETMWFAPDQKTAEGRWYWGEYHEFGVNVKMTRQSADPSIASVTPYAIKAGSKGVDIHIYGANFPKTLTPQDLDLGAGVAVKKIVSVAPNEVVATIDVAADAVSGQRDLGLHGIVLEKALPIYKKVDYLKVTPETGLAHLGGTKYAKGYEQFDVIGFENGPDGKPRTADDVALGSIPVNWTVEEFSTVSYDDDKAYVGALSQSALFTPALEGPNPKRKFSRNNYGDVWVVATAKNEKDSFGKPLSARAYLVVTVPTYKRWDQPEVSQ